MSDNKDQRKVYHISELPNDLVEAISTAKVDARHDHLNALLEPEARQNRKVGLTEELSEEMLGAVLNAQAPAEAAAFDAETLKGCVSYEGPVKTVEEMNAGIALSAAQDFFTTLAPADVQLSEELIRERREEGGAIVASIAVIIAAWQLLGDVKGADPIIQIRATLFVGFPAFIAVWVLRLISRRLVVNQALEQDAAERVAMIHAFKALEKEGKADPSERLLILQSLFRPATAPTDDTAPISVVNQLLKQNNGNSEEK